ncbi:MAG: hypothetical protein SGI96_07090 [Bacteroidota bacterium]|nr:hypothetical protein [Bacteroidota bacterium]
MRVVKLILLLLVFNTVGRTQTTTAENDTTSNPKALDSVTIISYLKQNIIQSLPATMGTYIFSGKKTEDDRQEGFTVFTFNSRGVLTPLRQTFIFSKC